MLDKLTAILDPTKRKALYAILGTVATLVAVLGWAPKVAVDNWVEVTVQVLGVLGLALASWKAKRVDYTALYAAGAALVAALTVAGVINDGAASQVYDIMAQVFAALPLLVATVRTNTKTPTGEPVAEYVARHGGVGPNGYGSGV